MCCWAPVLEREGRFLLPAFMVGDRASVLKTSLQCSSEQFHGASISLFPPPQEVLCVSAPENLPHLLSSPRLPSLCKMLPVLELWPLPALADTSAAQHRSSATSAWPPSDYFKQPPGRDSVFDWGAPGWDFRKSLCPKMPLFPARVN